MSDHCQHCIICGGAMTYNEGYGSNGDCPTCGTSYVHDEGPVPLVPDDLKDAIARRCATTEYHPQSLVVDCGDTVIKTKRHEGGPQTGHGTTITIDGVELTNVSAIDVRINCKEVVKVTVERIPEARE